MIQRLVPVDIRRESSIESLKSIRDQMIETPRLSEENGDLEGKRKYEQTS
ncbi:hypothetical protein [Thermoflavimicrobium dichotomicum]|nr:hypothetical protein [Thermoflavimicrobium dichotomicum]